MIKAFLEGSSLLLVDEVVGRQVATVCPDRSQRLGHRIGGVGVARSQQSGDKVAKFIVLNKIRLQCRGK